MVSQHHKGERRERQDLTRQIWGEPRVNLAKNRDRDSQYAGASKKAFHRKKGRDRFKTGHKSQRRKKN